MFILKSNSLELDEIKIWDCIIQWGIGQSKELLEKNISEWNEKDFEEMKDNLEDIVPLIRFDQITPTDFYEKFHPYRKALDKDVYKEILGYYLDIEWKPKLLPLRCPESLLNLEMKSLFVNWIDENQVSYNEDNLPYNFKLILHGSQDGISRAVFEETCYNVKQTIVIMKLKTGELIGGYNPLYWNYKVKSPDKDDYNKTGGSFIFKIDKNQINNSLLSRSYNSSISVDLFNRISNVTEDGIKCHEVLVNFYDLDIRNSIDNKPYCYYWPHRFYKKNLELIDKDKHVHPLEEYEIYKLIKRDQ